MPSGFANGIGHEVQVEPEVETEIEVASRVAQSQSKVKGEHPLQQPGWHPLTSAPQADSPRTPSNHLLL